MLKKIFTLLGIFIFGLSIGQNANRPVKGTAVLQGSILDTTNKKPVEFATVALLIAASKEVVDGNITDDKGEFEIQNVGAGEYLLEIDFLGYQTKQSKIIQVKDGEKVKLGKLYLVPETLVLGEVTIEGQTDIIEEKVDRLVYNAEKDITSKGGDAADVMRNVPLLTVDLDGNVSLRGNSNVKVLINNKPSSIMAGSVADALKQIPADMIKSIEVITSPSARYDSEGSSGIINIITKKNTLEGMTLGVDVRAGNRGANLGLNGNLRTGNMGFSLRGYGRAEYGIKGAFENVQTTQTSIGLQKSIQSATTLSDRLHGSYNLGWDWDITKKSNLSAGLRLGTRNGNSVQDNLISQTFLPGATIPLLSGRNVASKDHDISYDLNSTYTYTFKPQQELSLLGLVSRNNRDNSFEADLLNNVDLHTISARQKNDNTSYNLESTLEANYQAPTGERGLIEFGGKGIFRKVNSDYQYYLGEGTSNQFVLDESRVSNQLNYNQSVGAGYLSYTFTTKNKISVKAGARLEYADINASLFKTPDVLLDIPSYWSLAPSINLSKTITKKLTLKTAYNRRIQRPGIQYLNPNVNEANPTNISVGNPYLDPEFTDNYEVSASINLKAIYLNTSVFYRHTGNSITSLRDTFTTQNPNPSEQGSIAAIRTTYANIGNENTIGMNIFGNVTFFKIWQINGGIDLYNVSLTNNNPNPSYAASNSGLVMGGRLFSNLRLKKGWGIQGGGGGRGRQVNLQGYSGGFRFYMMGVKKDFNEGKGNVSLSAENFLNFPFKVTSESKSQLLQQLNTNSFYNAGVRIGLSYKIGKMNFVDRRKRKSINNDDMKSGGDGGGGGGDNGGDQQQAAPTPAGQRGGTRVQGTTPPANNMNSPKDTTAKGANMPLEQRSPDQGQWQGQRPQGQWNKPGTPGADTTRRQWPQGQRPDGQMRRPGQDSTMRQGQRPDGSQWRRPGQPGSDSTGVQGGQRNGQRLKGQPSDTNNKPGTEDKLINESKESVKLINPNDLKPMVNDSVQMKKDSIPVKKQ